jgi:hypothetical protein
MLKPKYWNVVLFLFVKTAVFAILIAFVDNRYISYITDPYKQAGILKNTITYIDYILIFGIIPSIIIYSLPIYLSFLVKRPLYFIAAILLIFTLDYLFYSRMGGFANNLEQFYFWISNILCFLIFFYRTVRIKFNDKKMLNGANNK